MMKPMKQQLQYRDPPIATTQLHLNTPVSNVCLERTMNLKYYIFLLKAHDIICVSLCKCVSL